MCTAFIDKVPAIAPNIFWFSACCFSSCLASVPTGLTVWCCNWNMLLTALSSFQSSIFQVFVTLPIWFPTSVLAKAWLSPTRHEQHSFRNSRSLLLVSCISSLLQKICTELLFIKRGEIEIKCSIHVKLLPTHTTMTCIFSTSTVCPFTPLNLLNTSFDEWLRVDIDKWMKNRRYWEGVSSSSIITSKAT